MSRINRPVTGAILAGGRSTRMGTDKADLELAWSSGERLSMIQHIHDVLAEVCAETLVVGGPERSGVAATMVPDDHPGAGPLGGILAALTAATNDRVFVVACDMPFINAGAITGLTRLLDDHDAVVPRVNARFETLHAVYATRCEGPIRKVLESGERKIRSFFPLVDVRIVEADEFAEIDPGGRSTENVNRPEEFESAARILKGGIRND